MSKYSFREPPLYQTYIENDSRMTFDMEFPAGEWDNSKSIWMFMDACNCPFCGSKLVEINNRKLEGSDKDGIYLTFYARIEACLICGWWRYEYLNATELISIHELAIGSILSIEDADFWAPVPAIREYLRKYPKYLRIGLSPIALEQVLKDVFSEYYNCEVHWTGRGPDGGFDLYHVLADGCSTLYQIKHRETSEKSESVIPIRALLGTLIIQNAVSGIYITTAENFSKTAISEVKIANEYGYKIELIDYNRLIDILRATSSKIPIPWRNLWNGACATYSYHKRNMVSM